MTRNTRGAGGGEIEVVAAPAHTVVQDLGRIGSAHLGVSRSGVADWLSARVLNRLIGNDDGAAVVEMSVGGGVFVVRTGVVDAVVGGRVGRAVVRSGGLDRMVPVWRVVRLRVDDVLRIEELAAGEKGYVAVRGGIDRPRVLGSRSTHAKSGVGGKPLAEGDRLGVCDGGGVVHGDVRVDRDALLSVVRVLGGEVVRAVLWGKGEGFSGALVEDDVEFVVDGRCDRVGVRLRLIGGKLKNFDHLSRSPVEVTSPGGDVFLSEGVGHGVVQSPGDGTLLVLGPDGSPTGGYPVVGTVICADLPVLAHRGVGARVRVRWVTVAEARTAMGDRLAMLDRVFGGENGGGGGCRDRSECLGEEDEG